MQTWFITGASGGLASRITQKLLERGDRVAATVRKEGVLDDLQKQYGSQLWQAQLDLTNAQQIGKTVERAFKELGTIDVILNNAAYGLYGAVEEVSDDQIEQLFTTNVFGSLRVARAALPFLRKQGRGQIIQISSMAGQYSVPAMGLYSSSKWAVEAAFEALAKEVEPFGIKTTIVEPGGIRTDFAAGKAVFGNQTDAYQNTEAGKTISMMKGNIPNLDIEKLKKMVVGDPDKMAEQIVRRADQGEGPLRMALGSDAYQKIRASLLEKLEALDAQKELACSTDADDAIRSV